VAWLHHPVITVDAPQGCVHLHIERLFDPHCLVEAGANAVQQAIHLNQITEIRNCVNSYKVTACDGKICVTPTHQVLSTNHMKVENVDDILCLTFPFFNVDKKDGKKI
jgi:hypothetical protein